MTKSITLSLGRTKVDKMLFTDIPEDVNNFFDFSEGDISLGYDVLYGENNSFSICFSVGIKTRNRLLHCQYSAFFNVNSEIDEKFKSSHFPSVNAPAIAYPFLRAFIITFLVNAGYDKFNMPSINFLEFSKKNKSEKSKKTHKPD